jgi:C4-type Zn-finger protein
MGIEAPIDPPDDGMFEESEWECPGCDEVTYCTEWVEMTGRYEAIITTICNSCDYQKTSSDWAYGYDG